MRLHRRHWVVEAAKLCVAITVMMLAASVVVGFVDRGEKIDSQIRAADRTAGTIEDLLHQNRLLQEQMAQRDWDAKARAREATRQRAALERQIEALTRALRDNGITVPPTD